LIKKIIFLILILKVFLFSTSVWAGGEQSNLGIGVKAGINRLFGDWKNPSFKPFAYGQLTYNLFEFLAIGGEAGYSTVGDKDNPAIETILVPYEGHLIFSFLPLGKVNPYVVLGGGGVYWNYTEDGQTKIVDGKYQEGYDSFLKAGIGLEILLNRSHTFYFNLGGTFRYSLTDWFDNIKKTDKNDGLVGLYGGFTYYFRTSRRGDRDNDGVPDELDLEIDIKEDPDGYLDHDGNPEGIPPITIKMISNDSTEVESDKDPPIVIHAPVKRVEEGRDVTIKADIYENQKLKVASILYRPIGLDHWSIGQLRSAGGTLYEGVIPHRSVKKEGLEYCVIAVDEAVSGVGYSGVPKLPVRVEVLRSPKTWRIVGGAAALVGLGASSYIILKKEK